MIEAIFFDFDGTLADTAPDLVAATNLQRVRAGLAPLPFEELRPFTSQGSPGLLKKALNLSPDDAQYASVREQFLADYQASNTQHTKLFTGIPEILNMLEQRHIKWGIVTNKQAALSIPIFKHFGFDKRSAANICGDTAARAKPYPDPLLLAAERAKVNPANCIYVGDDERDIIAGKAANMKTIALSYGYCPNPELIPQWQADKIVDRPEDLLTTILDFIA